MFCEIDEMRHITCIKQGTKCRGKLAGELRTSYFNDDEELDLAVLLLNSCFRYNKIFKTYLNRG